jgi:iron complex outermembrane receptor protein
MAQAVAPAEPPKAEAPKEKEETIKLMEFFVKDKGVSRATNSITPAEVRQSLPGVSVEKLLSFVPGVNIVTRDPFGFYEFGNDIRVRAFDITRLAVTIDDVPMGNNSARYGTPAGRIVDGENLSSINVSQGTGDVTSPAYEALGGSIKYYTAIPPRDPSATLSLSMGDFSALRLFARYNTGELIPGLTAYVSTSKLEFKTAGIPETSEGNKVEGKISYVTPKATYSFAYTWNDRDDYDTRGLQWDRWRAMETGNPYAGYGTSYIYSAAERVNLTTLAQNGYAVYLPSNFPALSTNIMGDYTDKQRKFGATSYIDANSNPGDGFTGSQYYKYYRNGRMDSFFRGSADFTVTEAITVKSSAYYQDRHNYGTFPVARGDARTQIVNAYNGTKALRTDIWPRWAYRDAANNLVPYGTPGAIPVGYNDTNNNGFFDSNETLNASLTPTALSNAHALIAPTSTSIATATSGIPGAVGRDEDFGGQRWGVNLKGIWNIGRQQITVGGWYEDDEQQANRPTYNLFGGSPIGGFLYDQVLFLNYNQNFGTYATMFYAEDAIKFFDDKLTITPAIKSLNVKRTAKGILYTQAWYRPPGTQRDVREVTYKDSFLPQLGISYRLSSQFDVFANYAENLAAPQPAVIANVDFNVGLSPETAKNYDAGIRYSSPNFGASFAVFYNKYEERILSIAFTQEELIAAGLAGVTGATRYRNVGGIEGSGAELSYEWRTPIRGLKLTGALAYQKSIFEGDIRIPYASFHNDPADPRSKFYRVEPGVNGAAPTISYELQKGKTQGNTPKYTANADLVYTYKNLSVNFGGQFYDSVYLNTLNTESIPSYTVFRGGLTLRGSKGTRLAPFTASVTVQNIFDRYFWYAAGYTGSYNGSIVPDYGRNVSFTVSASF